MKVQDKLDDVSGDILGYYAKMMEVLFMSETDDGRGTP
jgi:hypothetical protein